MGRAPCCEKVGLKRGRWTAEEDGLLTKYILSNGEGSWRSLPKNAGLLRCGKSCRLRWINYLRADLKRGNITKEEEETIVKLHTSLGNRWSLIAANIPGRTDNEIKNYWNSHLSRRIYTFRRNPYASSPTTTAAAHPPPPLLLKPKTCTSNYSTGRTSRAAMRKQRAALTSLRKKERQHLLAQRNQDPVVHSEALISFSTQISEGSGPGSTTASSSDRNGTPDLELGSSRGKFNAAEDGGDADVCCSGGDGGGGREEDESLGPYEWLDSEIMRLEYVLQEGENSIDSLRQEDTDVAGGGGGNNGGGRRPIHGGEIMIESDWADIRSSPSPGYGPGPGPRMGDDGLDFVFDWDWPAGGDGDRHHHHPSQWEWDLLWGGDDGIGSLTPLNCDEN